MPAQKEDSRLYRPVLAEAWIRTWKDKWLWLVGLFATFAVGGGALEVIPGAMQDVEQAGAYFFPSFWKGLLAMLRSAPELGGFDGVTVVWLGVLLALLVALTVFLIFVAVASYGTLILAAGEKAKKWSLSKLWHKAVRKFWQLFLVLLTMKIVIAGLTSIAGAPLSRALQSGALGAALAVAFPLYFTAIVFLAFIAAFLGIYAACAVMREDARYLEAWQKALGLFRSHWVISVEMAIINFLAGLLTAVAGVVGLVFLFTPASVLAIVSGLVGVPALGGIFVMVGILTFVIYLIVLGALYTTFTTLMWVGLYRRLTLGGARAKVHRVWEWAFGA